MGILDREGQSSMNITGQKGQTLDILVERFLVRGVVDVVYAVCFIRNSL